MDESNIFNRPADNQNLEAEAEPLWRVLLSNIKSVGVRYIDDTTGVLPVTDCIKIFSLNSDVVKYNIAAGTGCNFDVELVVTPSEATMRLDYNNLVSTCKPAVVEILGIQADVCFSRQDFNIRLPHKTDLPELDDKSTRKSKRNNWKTPLYERYNK